MLFLYRYTVSVILVAIKYNSVCVQSVSFLLLANYIISYVASYARNDILWCVVNPGRQHVIRSSFCFADIGGLEDDMTTDLRPAAAAPQSDLQVIQSYEVLVRNYVDSTVQAALCYARETELAKRVREWEEQIQPILSLEVRVRSHLLLESPLHVIFGL